MSQPLINISQESPNMTTDQEDIDSPPEESFVEDDISTNEGAGLDEYNEESHNTDTTATMNQDINQETHNTQPQCRLSRAANPPNRLQISHGGKLYHSLSEKQFLNYKSEAVKYIAARESHQLSKMNLLQRATDIIFTMADNKTLAPSPQMTASKGIKLYGEIAVSAMIKEFKQLINGAFPGKPVVEAIKLEDLTEEDKRTAQEHGWCPHVLPAHHTDTEDSACPGEQAGPGKAVFYHGKIQIPVS